MLFQLKSTFACFVINLIFLHNNVKYLTISNNIIINKIIISTLIVKLLNQQISFFSYFSNASLTFFIFFILFLFIQVYKILSVYATSILQIFKQTRNKIEIKWHKIPNFHRLKISSWKLTFSQKVCKKYSNYILRIYIVTW